MSAAKAWERETTNHAASRQPETDVLTRRMTSRERMLIALDNGRPDRLPCQVHGWMDYYLNRFLGGIDWYEACAKFDMDYAIYVSPEYTYAESDLARWQCDRRQTGTDSQGNHCWEETISTPKGTLHQTGAWNEITSWSTEHLIKNEGDFELWDRFFPVPLAADLLRSRRPMTNSATGALCAAIRSAPARAAPGKAFAC